MNGKLTFEADIKDINMTVSIDEQHCPLNVCARIHHLNRRRLDDRILYE